MTKLEQFKIRNRKRNRHLYTAESIEGIDFVVCPVSGERLSVIRNDYISKILGIDPNVYWKQYEHIQRCSQKRKTNIKKGLSVVDDATGLTKHAISIKKSQVTKRLPDSQGQTIHQKIGQKTRATHMSNIDQFGRNGYSQNAVRNIIKGNQTKADRGLILYPHERSLYYRYKTMVLHLTTKNRHRLLEGTDIKLGLAGEPNAYHIDHKYSIYSGWKNKVSPLIIANIENLQLLPWKENISKHTRSSIDLEQLLSMCNTNLADNKDQFDKIMQILIQDSQDDVPPTGAFVLERYYATTLL